MEVHDRGSQQSFLCHLWLMTFLSRLDPILRLMKPPDDLVLRCEI